MDLTGCNPFATLAAGLRHRPVPPFGDDRGPVGTTGKSPGGHYWGRVRPVRAANDRCICDTRTHAGVQCRRLRSGLTWTWRAGRAAVPGRVPDRGARGTGTAARAGRARQRWQPAVGPAG